MNSRELADARKTIKEALQSDKEYRRNYTNKIAVFLHAQVPRIANIPHYDRCLVMANQILELLFKNER